ncbi:nicotinate-nucleotide adenylyltransferase [Desulfuromonas carbonis]|uniref:nicotinate-nucleotide adenylyltransferase n=1 Tax=Desulfuromonas sp. DDH964 TaxID=1823759 RepID=UPI00078C0550|nr:nicotinate-nucleotide adenylyltransferase [Desulfuromonas sp. DDH964]AMV71156.1 nicotinate/nicotinamide mononucleotide adenylyltransferase [Desulfuromonas sp. DDH964]
MRIGIFGGTFNPIHLAHLRVAEEVREVCALDRVMFLPAATPPHKSVAEEVPFAERLAMVEAAIADHPDFFASDLEGRRLGKSFSVDTLEILRREQPSDEFFFLIGMDSFRDLPTWRDYRRLFSLAHIVVAPRPGVNSEQPQELLPVAMRDQFCYDATSKTWRHAGGTSLIFLAETYLDISSTRIRQLVAAGRSIRYLVPPAVAEHIRHRGFYRPLER